MLCNNTSIEVNKRVKLKNITDQKELNGLIGTTTHAFPNGKQGKGWLGVYLERGNCNTPYIGTLNVKQTEIELLERD